MKHVVFTDFDGTVTAKDTIDAMYDAFGPDNWPAVAKDLYARGLRSRQIIKRMLGMIDASREQIVELLRTLPIREGFVEFREFCRSNGYELLIMSEGIGLSVETVLHERGIDDLPYFGNVLVQGHDGRWTTENPHLHPDCSDCGNCKSTHIIDRKKEGDAAIYIGDGATDRCAAQVADIVFATGYLAKFCARTHIPFVPFDTFRDVIAEMAKGDFAMRLEAEAVRDLERKTTPPSLESTHLHCADRNPYDKGR
jgi:2,3-diketo-5-methylthio-1-phosphopentane phosphatase